MRVLFLLPAALLLSCSQEPIEVGSDTSAVHHYDDDDDDDDDDVDECHYNLRSGKKLFKKETFGGNGRTCKTCHKKKSGALSPANVQTAFANNPNHPLFVAIDSDDGLGLSYNRLLDDATFRVHIDLPDNVVLTADPSATEVVVPRGASTVLNNPGLETVFMQDGRNLSLQDQAHGAVNAHYEAQCQPTERQLNALNRFQKRKKRFYSSRALRRWARNGTVVPLPTGSTAEEIRGKVWFENTAEGVCGHCHGGDFLNETSVHILAPLPQGSRFFTAFVSEFNTAGNEVKQYEFSDPANPSAPPVLVQSPDPGRALITGNAADANFFRIPTLWGSKYTAPYFHDNSAADFQELMDHYQAYFATIGVAMDEQDKIDIIAYLQLLE